jgi:KaiC/GvpD/RAD55 family RecA-like ATPase
MRDIIMVIRAILANWADSTYKKVREGVFTAEEIEELNSNGYNIYYLPNSPSNYNAAKTVEGADIDVFQYVFCDMDLKENKYDSKEDFVEKIKNFVLTPSKIVDSGNGIHVYWKVTDLDAMSYLKLQRRLIRHFNTDEAVGQIFQLMRLPGTVNTKNPDDLKLCETIMESDSDYTCEELDAALPPLAPEDAQYCQQHYDKTYKIASDVKVNDKLPVKFGALLKNSKEAKDIWSGNLEDRSKGDYRLAHLMFAHGFTKDEAMSVLVNSSKAMARAPKHRVSYASNIVDKIWTFEQEKQATPQMSNSVKDILKRGIDTLKGTRFPCYSYLDNTAHGFRLGQVIGLVAGSGVGKTAIALNMFMGFVENNPDYTHFFIPLEQPAREIADRWQVMCGDREELHEKVHVLSNYDDEGNFRHLSLDEIEQYLIKFQEENKVKVGCVVIDHIGALKKKGKQGENQDLMDICHAMKAFAMKTNTLLVMQSQTSREKAGIGDLELNKDAAYGTMYFEAYCDYLITIWQPLKRCYNKENCPTVTAFKFCKIRHKKKGQDVIQEDVPYTLIFDATTERLREMTQDEEKSFDFFNKQATNLRKNDRKTDLVIYTTIKTEGVPHGKANDNQDFKGIDGIKSVH